MLVVLICIPVIGLAFAHVQHDRGGLIVPEVFGALPVAPESDPAVVEAIRLQDEIETLKRRVSALERERLVLDERLAKSDRALEQAVQRATDAEARASAAEERLEALRRQASRDRAAFERQLAALRSERDRLRQRIEAISAENTRLVAARDAAVAPAAPPIAGTAEPVPSSPATEPEGAGEPTGGAPGGEAQLDTASRAPATPDSTGPEAAPAPEPPSSAPNQAPTGADGVAAYNAGDYRRAFEIWSYLAERGNRKAMFHLGAMYFEGRLGTPDYVSAYVWLERADRAGYPLARDMLDRLRPLMSREELAEARASLGS